MNYLNAVTLAILAIAFVLVTYIGFASARWRPAENPLQLNEWGLGGRGFGTFVTWFLLGGDIYTAYTFIAVPALVYATGAAGFYALSYTIMVFPIVFIFAPRLWSVARARGYVTPGEFVRGRYGSQGLGLAVAVTGILATMPYIALQLVGIESVLTVLGVGSTSGNAFVRDLPLIIAFAVVAAYTYLAGLRAPALIAFVKDILIYVTVIVAILYIPGKLGGWTHIFGTASAHLKTVNPATHKPYGSIVVLPAGQWAYATLALGSALALFVYPHATTGVFAAKRRDVIRRNAAVLPVYTLLLGLVALLGYMARSVPAVNAGVKAGGGNAQLSVPLLFAHMFPSWFAGVADAAIVVGALVPAAIMSIAAANLFTRTIYKELLKPGATPAQETRVARLASLVMKVGALGFALELNRTFSINLQLLGGIWILQTFPAIVISLYTRWFHRAALIIGWAVAMVYGTVQAYRTPGGGQAHFGASAAPVFGHVTYIAITALILNLAVSAVLTLVFRQVGLQDGYDATKPGDYVADPVTAPPSAPAPRAPRHAACRTAGAASGKAGVTPGRTGTAPEPADAAEPASAAVQAAEPEGVPAPAPVPAAEQLPGPFPAPEPSGGPEPGSFGTSEPVAAEPEPSGTAEPAATPEPAAAPEPEPLGTTEPTAAAEPVAGAEALDTPESAAAPGHFPEPEPIPAPWPGSSAWADAATTQPLPIQPPAPPVDPPLPPAPRPPRKFAFITRERAASRKADR